MDNNKTKQKIQKLVDKYEQVVKTGKLNRYSEEETKKDFILPLFEILGWDIFNKNEVSAEESIKSGGRVDYGFYLNERTKFSSWAMIILTFVLVALTIVLIWQGFK